MAFGVPMMIGGGEAHHPADLMRKLTANFFYGTEGVIRAPDCAIKAYEAPTSAVRMMPGGAAVLNRAPQASREAYFDHSGVEEMVPIAPTGSSGPRSDLIMARVEDPYSAGAQWQKPSSTKDGPYMFARVEPGVSRQIYTPHQLGKGWSAIPLARVDQPANNTAITQAMITDLRSIANGPQRWQEPNPPAIPDPPQVDQATWTDSRRQLVAQTLRWQDRTWIDWPSRANWRVKIPDWACGVDIFFVVQNPQQWDHHVYGELNVGIGDHFGPSSEFDMDAMPVPDSWPKAAKNAYGLSTCPNRHPLFHSVTLGFTGAFRNYPGTVRTVKATARMYDDANTRGRLVADAKTVMYLNLSFLRYPTID